jgi:hypothetical protein
VGDNSLSRYGLGTSGKIKQVVGGLGLPNGSYCAYTPNGRHLLLAAKQARIHRWDIQANLTSTLTVTDGSYPCGLYLVEDPPLAFIQYTETAKVTVVSYRDLVSYRQTLAPSSPGSGYWVCAKGDGSRAFCCSRLAMGAGTTYIMESRRVGAGSSGCDWAKQLTYKLPSACVGPDPAHLLITSLPPKPDKDLYIYNMSDGMGILGCYLTGVTPGEIALTPDGAYAVVTGYTEKKIMVISGLDLRARLDPGTGMAPTGVRKATLSLGSYPQGVALHPTLPIAYVWSRADRKIEVVHLAIPGVEHP